MILFLPLAEGRANELRVQALNFERQGRWFEACCLYDELLSKDRSNAEVRDSYRLCLRQFRQQRRLEDVTLQTMLGKLTASESSDLYEQIVGLVVENYPERDRVDLTVLFTQGLRELRAAADKKALLLRTFRRITDADLSAFRIALDQWEGEKINSQDQARLILRRIIVAGGQAGLTPGFLALEFACGAANSLDEYSLYLAPARVAPAYSHLKNKIIGIGVELTVVGQRLEVARVYRRSPAADAGLVKGDRLVRIDGVPVDPQAPDLAAERLLGDAGVPVELEYVPRGQTMSVLVKVDRQLVQPVSVDHELRSGMGNSYVGYLQIHHFQESTLQEVKDILAQWQMMPVRGIILDVRGNPGGNFKSALGIAELFLPESVIVHTTSPVEELTTTYRSQNPNPNTQPLAVLVDGDTASSAEVLAAALKDNKRAMVIGQPTYGKGSIQCVIPLKRAPGGLKLTVAKLSSPSRTSLSGRGVLPMIPLVDPDPEAAIKEAEQQFMPAMMMYR